MGVTFADRPAAIRNSLLLTGQLWVISRNFCFWTVSTVALIDHCHQEGELSSILDRSIDHPEKWPELIYYVWKGKFHSLIQINLNKRGDDSGRSSSQFKYLNLL